MRKLLPHNDVYSNRKNKPMLLRKIGTNVLSLPCRRGKRVLRRRRLPADSNRWSKSLIFKIKLICRHRQLTNSTKECKLLKRRFSSPRQRKNKWLQEQGQHKVHKK